MFGSMVPQGTLVTAYCYSGKYAVDPKPGQGECLGRFESQDKCGPLVLTAIDLSLCQSTGLSSLKNVFGALVCRDGVTLNLPNGSWSESCGPSSWDASRGHLSAYCSKGADASTIGLTSINIFKEWGPEVVLSNVYGDLKAGTGFLPAGMKV